MEIRRLARSHRELKQKSVQSKRCYQFFDINLSLMEPNRNRKD